MVADGVGLVVLVLVVGKAKESEGSDGGGGAVVAAAVAAAAATPAIRRCHSRSLACNSTLLSRKRCISQRSWLMLPRLRMAALPPGAKEAGTFVVVSVVGTRRGGRRGREGEEGGKMERFVSGRLGAEGRGE